MFAAAAATRAGIHSQHLTRLLAEGTLERVARGHYRFAARPVTGHHRRVVAAGAAPHGVICLLSALAFHQIGAQLPSEVWVAIEHRTNAIPRVFAENA
jgi:predicted transcriptional regulator of viral defense system